jgi:hypothetical protein
VKVKVKLNGSIRHYGRVGKERVSDTETLEKVTGVESSTSS